MTLLAEKKGLLIAVGFGLLAAFLFFIWMNRIQKDLDEQAKLKIKNMQENMAEVIFAKRDIQQGESITEEMIYTKLKEKNKIPPGVVISSSRVIGTIAREAIQKDSVIMSDQLKWQTTRDTTLSMRTPIGKRAITISVDNISLLAGMMSPGDYVDVIGLIALPLQVEGKQSIEAATVPLFQNVLVLALGTNIRTPEEQGRPRAGGESNKDSGEASPLVTLALSPEEVNLLAFVQEQGKIRLVLRSPGDAKVLPVQPANWETLLKYLFPNTDFNPPLPVENPIEVKKGPQVEIIRGFQKEVVALE